jgi:hypothetical protein
MAVTRTIFGKTCAGKYSTITNIRERMRKKIMMSKKKQCGTSKEDYKKREVPILPTLPTKQNPPFKREEQQNVEYPHKVNPIQPVPSSTFNEFANPD